MLIIQIILIVAIILIISRLIFKLRGKEINLGIFFTWLVIWLAAMVVIWWPDITSFLAIKVGVTRGVDLVVYVSVILVFYLLFRLLLRIEKIESDITKIVREVALKDKDKNE
ncbi:MAG: DUF2304 domain-containing protein [Patescibacteria group bacterium]